MHSRTEVKHVKVKQKLLSRNLLTATDSMNYTQWYSPVPTVILPLSEGFYLPLPSWISSEQCTNTRRSHLHHVNNIYLKSVWWGLRLNRWIPSSPQLSCLLRLAWNSGLPGSFLSRVASTESAETAPQPVLWGSVETWGWEIVLELAWSCSGQAPESGRGQSLLAHPEQLQRACRDISPASFVLDPVLPWGFVIASSILYWAAEPLGPAGLLHCAAACPSMAPLCNCCHCWAQEQLCSPATKFHHCQQHAPGGSWAAPSLGSAGLPDCVAATGTSAIHGLHSYCNWIQCRALGCTAGSSMAPSLLQLLKIRALFYLVENLTPPPMFLFFKKIRFFCFSRESSKYAERSV